MKISARGWHRDCGPNILAEVDVDDAEPYPEDNFRRGRTYFRKKSTGEIEIITGPNNIILNGNYQVIFNLNKDDIKAIIDRIMSS